VWTDIGEAEVTHAIFGRAKVRIVREQDKKRRTWLLTALAVAAMAAAAWQGWFASQQTEPLRSAVPTPPSNTSAQESVPTLQPEYILHPAIPPAVRSKPGTPSQTEINKPAISRKSAPQPPLGLKGAEQITAKPVTDQQLKASQPQTTPVATNPIASKNQTDKQLPYKPSPPKQPVATVVATTPATQLAASSPAAVAPHVAPLVMESDSTQSPAGDKQLADPINAQH